MKNKHVNLCDSVAVALAVFFPFSFLLALML